MHSGGRPRNTARDAVAERFGLNSKSFRVRRMLTPQMLAQLDRCYSDCERRLILGLTPLCKFDHPDHRKYRKSDSLAC